MTTGEQGQTDGVEPGTAGHEEFRSPDQPSWSMQRQIHSIDESTDAPANVQITTMLQLSLFLMLLTFFLVLTAGTSFDERRVGPVIGGIQSAFGVFSSGRHDQEGGRYRAPLPVTQTGALPATGAYASDVEAAFAAFGGDGSETVGASLNMLLRTERLFVEGSAAIRADQRGLFRQVGQLLQIDGHPRHIAVLVPPDPELRLDVRRAASIARLLLEDGAPATQVAVGVKEVGEGLISFQFYTMPVVVQ